MIPKQYFLVMLPADSRLIWAENDPIVWAVHVSDWIRLSSITNHHDLKSCSVKGTMMVNWAETPTKSSRQGSVTDRILCSNINLSNSPPAWAVTLFSCYSHKLFFCFALKSCLITRNNLVHTHRVYGPGSLWNCLVFNLAMLFFCHINKKTNSSCVHRA